jgi:hypothetical protein
MAQNLSPTSANINAARKLLTKDEEKVAAERTETGQIH